MLKRIYVNNFRCLVNFELDFDNINLILGHNGSGKSTLFDVIRKLQQFIVGESRIEEVFSQKDITRWQTTDTQSFELEFADGDDIYVYILKIIYLEKTEIPRIKTESLLINNDLLIEFRLSEEESHGQIKAIFLEQKETLSEEIIVESAPSYRSIFEYFNKTNAPKISWIKDNISDFSVIKINPFSMNSESRTEDDFVNSDLSNFSSWYSHLSLSEQGKIIKLTLELQKVLIGFDSFQNTKIGEARLLSAIFTKPIKASYKFDELSEGQKVLIALYTLLYCTPENSTLMIDEPENFLALPEIQPWLSKLIDRCQEDNLQAILISHHPSVINELATEYGYWFERQDNQAVRVQKIVDQGEEGGLSIAKLIEMGWIYDQ